MKIITTAADKKLSSFTLTTNQNNALYDASFNLGPGKVSQYNEEGTKNSGENFFFKFMGDGEGIRKRRFAENLLYSEGTYNSFDVLKGKKQIASAVKVVSDNEPKPVAKKED